MKILDYVLGSLGMFALDGLGLLGSHTDMRKPTVWLVTEGPHSIVLAVCDSKRSAYLFRMRYMCEELQKSRNTTLMYGRMGSREHHRETVDNDFCAFRPNVSEKVVEVHSPAHADPGDEPWALISTPAQRYVPRMAGSHRDGNQRGITSFSHFWRM